MTYKQLKRLVMAIERKALQAGVKPYAIDALEIRNGHNFEVNADLMFNLVRTVEAKVCASGRESKALRSEAHDYFIQMSDKNVGANNEIV